MCSARKNRQLEKVNTTVSTSVRCDIQAGFSFKSVPSRGALFNSKESQRTDACASASVNLLHWMFDVCKNEEVGSEVDLVLKFSLELIVVACA